MVETLLITGAAKERVTLPPITLAVPPPTVIWLAAPKTSLKDETAVPPLATANWPLQPKVKAEAATEPVTLVSLVIERD